MKASTLRIGTLARINPHKKLEDLIAAIRKAHRRLPPYRLLIAGDPEHGCEDYLQSLRRLAIGLPVEFVGEQTNVPQFLSDLDLFVMISEPAGCPNASLEAMAAGVPVIATDHGGASEQIVDRVTGRVTPRGDNAALGDAIVELASDPMKRNQYCKAGRTDSLNTSALTRWSSVTEKC